MGWEYIWGGNWKLDILEDIITERQEMKEAGEDIMLHQSYIEILAEVWREPPSEVRGSLAHLPFMTRGFGGAILLLIIIPTLVEGCRLSACGAKIS